jgi:hypothetical protein
MIMTNRVDIYQPESDKLTVPAGGAYVFIEGRLCEHLEVTEINQGGMNEFGSARMRLHTNGVQADGEIEIGKPVIIKWLYNNLYPAGGAEEIVIFAGEVEKIETNIGPDGEDVEIVARDFSAAMERITVFGRQVRDVDGRVIFLESVSAVFNEAGQPNASSEMVEHKGDTIRLFAANSSGARFWNCADVIRYLLCEYVPKGQLSSPDQQRLRAIAGDESVRELDVTGKSLLDAIGLCCEQAGLEFKFVPRLGENGPQQAIVFYRKGKGRSVELNLQQAGTRLSVSKTNIWKARGRQNFWPVTHRHTGEGDYRVFEATFNLVKGWRWLDEDIDYEKFSPATNPEFHKVRDVWRKWCLNETGEYTGEPFNQGPAYDFSPVFGSDKYVHRRRRFWPALSCDSQRRSLGYFLEYSVDDGVHWGQYPYAFENLLDECGIWLSSSRLDIETWIAAVKGVLKFKITATVVSDERLRCEVADGPVGSATPVVEHIIEAANRFKFRKVTGKSKFAGGNSPGGADEADDTAALYQFVRRRSETEAKAIETFDVQTPYLGLGFEVGDIVKTNPDDRDIFSVRSDNRSTCIIERVRMDFENQSTELKITRRRL